MIAIELSQKDAVALLHLLQSSPGSFPDVVEQLEAAILDSDEYGDEDEDEQEDEDL